jgi:hypothetical protein
MDIENAHKLFQAMAATAPDTRVKVDIRRIVCCAYTGFEKLAAMISTGITVYCRGERKRDLGREMRNIWLRQPRGGSLTLWVGFPPQRFFVTT